MNECPRRLNGVKLEPVADGFIVHLPEKEQVHYLNNTAAIILELCDGQLSAGQIAAALQELYDLPEPPVAEVGECLETLRKQVLVT
jgi:Coenzyme PQQ synthesis protein D (PqqD)